MNVSKEQMATFSLICKRFVLPSAAIYMFIKLFPIAPHLFASIAIPIVFWGFWKFILFAANYIEDDDDDTSW